MQASAGPDGYVALSVKPHFRAHATLAAYLTGRQNAGPAGLDGMLRRLRKDPPADQSSIVLAIHTRIGWIEEHATQLRHPRRWQDDLAELARGLYGPKLSFDDKSLVTLLDSHRAYPALWGFGPEELVLNWLESHDMTPLLAEALRRFQAGLTAKPGSMKYGSQAAFQIAVQHVHMMLWHDPSDALDPATCWSDRIRADLRAMADEERTHWTALFRHIKGNATARPSPRWLAGAEERWRQVGPAAFRDRFLDWFAPFRSAEPQAVTVAGSHILRGLLWYASVSGDTALATASLALLDTRWKAKRNIDKAMVALVNVLAILPPEIAWPSVLRLQQEWPTSSVQVERFLMETAAGFGITEEELKARALLKPRLDIQQRLARGLDAVLAIRPAAGSKAGGGT